MKSSVSAVRSFFPILDTLKNYSGDLLKGDLNAGVTVGVMLIPQGMAYAILAGLPPIYGLYASIVPLLVYAIFGTSRQLAVGPVAMVALLVVAGVGEFAEVGSARFIQLAILTALGVGVVQFLMGIFRMGFLVNFLSHPVLSGFTSAAALIIGASQFPNLLGLDIPRTKNVFLMVWNVLQNVSAIGLFTAIIGIGSIVAILLMKKWKKTFPSALVVVALGTVATWLFSLNQAGVAVVGDIPKGLPAFSLEFLHLGDFQMLIPIILVIALVSYMESIAVAKAVATKRNYKVDPNQELVALGSANIFGSLFQAFPTTGGFSRTAVNDQSGSNTTISSVISAGIIALTVLFLTPLFYYLPKAVLAAIIMVAVAGLFDLKEMKSLWQTDRKDLVMLLVTFIATLLLGIEEGIAIGVVLSLAMVIYSSTRPHTAELGRLGDSRNYRNTERYRDAETVPSTLVYRFDASIYFANVEHLNEDLGKRMERHGETLKTVVFDASSVNSIDSTGAHALHELIDTLREKGIEFRMAGLIGPVRDRMRKSGLMRFIGEENVFFDVSEAMESISAAGSDSEGGEKQSSTTYGNPDPNGSTTVQSPQENYRKKFSPTQTNVS
jgi:SulP family sulfate permease